MSDLTNARKEFLKDVANDAVVCARLATIGEFDCDTSEYIFNYIDLRPGYTDVEYQEFLKKLDFEYDSGYGAQKLFGEILCENNIWFTRAEYDGAEWWIRHECPTPTQVMSKEFEI